MSHPHQKTGTKADGKLPSLLNLLFCVFQIIQPLFSGSVDDSCLDRVEHIGDAALRFLQLLVQDRQGAALAALQIHHGVGDILQEKVQYF